MADLLLPLTLPERDPAAEAFARLEGEIALVRRAVEQLATEKGEIVIPDYSETLGEMAQNLAAIAGKPAMQLTPEALASRIEAAAKAARQADAETLRQANRNFESGSAAMRQIAGIAQTVQDQRRRRLWTALGSLVAGCILWSFLPGVIARTVPAGWHWPEAMATRMLGEPTLWEAGVRLMRADSPEAWQAVAETMELRRDNREAIDRCREAVNAAHRPERCMIEVRSKL